MMGSQDTVVYRALHVLWMSITKLRPTLASYLHQGGDDSPLRGSYRPFHNSTTLVRADANPLNNNQARN